ncbi:fatty-acid amide hydrolase 2-A-like isoform X2 [Paramacrobiotus metropolitanus]|uniref:fatty-acid amide hydrolase 2-A-like isoform X2 n=1 Tax=Paramacrobiotus metropolitanus TaxID=2943436 RepID=UPI002445DDD3|nr:fatty-acid amide hydrolase 2-A-like isoform X2 [Paramacrobiotus metropolitanus]
MADVPGGYSCSLGVLLATGAALLGALWFFVWSKCSKALPNGGDPAAAKASKAANKLTKIVDSLQKPAVLPPVGEDPISKKWVAQKVVATRQAVGTQMARITRHIDQIVDLTAPSVRKREGVAIEGSVNTIIDNLEEMVDSVKFIAAVLEDDKKGDELYKTTHKLVEAVRNLLDTARFDDASRRQLLMEAIRVGEAGKEIVHCVNSAEYQDSLINTVADSTPNLEASVGAITLSTSQLCKAPEPAEMIRQAKILLQATAELVKGLKSEGEAVTGKGLQQHPLAAAKQLEDATTRLLEAAKLCAAAPHDQDRRQAMRDAAVNIRDLAQQTSVEVGPTCSCSSIMLITYLVSYFQTSSKRMAQASTETMEASQGEANDLRRKYEEELDKLQKHTTEYWTLADWMWWFIRFAMDLVSNLVFSIFTWIFGTKQRLPPIRSELLLQSATSTARRIRAGEISSYDVTEAYIQRLKHVNPIVNGMVAERFEAARREASELDRRLRSIGFDNLDQSEFSEERQPFLGVPISVKESWMVKGMPFTAGTPARKGILAEEDCEAVRRLRDAGAIILGVTNIPEICMWWETSNKLYGRSNNPYDPNRATGGSSGGEGVIVGAAGSPCGLGSDIGGSIRMPAFFCGVFGHKPTRGLTPLEGKYPPATDESARFATVGPLCRYAEDLAPFCKVLLGPNAKALSLDTEVDLSKLRVHYLLQIENPFITPVERCIKDAVLKAVMHLTGQFKAQLVPEKDFKSRMVDLRYASDIWKAEVIHNPTHSYAADMVNGKGKLDPVHEFGRLLCGRSEHTLIALYLAWVEQHKPDPAFRLESEFVKILGDDGILILPTHPHTAPYHNRALAMHMNFIYTSVFNAIGLPSTHVPMGLDKNGLPYGIQVVSNFQQDRLSLAVARQLEKAFGGWRSP